MRLEITRRAVPLVSALVVLQPAAAAGRTEHWQAPVVGPLHVLRPFAPPTAPWGPGHRGVDLAAAPGDPVLAAGAGTVRFAGQVGGRGVVVVEHAAGLRTEYEPVVPTVREGARVAAGAPVGVLAPPIGGHCGTSSAACIGGCGAQAVYEDPMRLLQPPSAPVLLPFLDRPIPGAESDRATQAASTGAGVDAAARPTGRVRQLVVAGGAAAGGGLAGAAAPALGRVIRPGRDPQRDDRPWRASGTHGSR